MTKDTPLSSLGFHMPAEWEPHSAVWLAWPYDRISFGSLNEPDGKPDRERLTRVESKFAEIIAELSKSEQVELLVMENQEHSNILTNIRMLPNVTIHEVDYADVWTRDYAPSFVLDGDGKSTAVKWEYNAYSKKFPMLIKDNGVFKKLQQELKMKMIEPGMVMEGGAIEVNGNSTLLTTEQCLLKRNPNLSKGEIEKFFSKYLGIKKTIWLKDGIMGDHTDGHIDEVAKFIAVNKVVCAYEDNNKDENYEILKNAYEFLKAELLEVIKLPMPHMTYHGGERAPASYVNFYIGNKVVLMPTFNDPNDAKALEIIRSQFPNRKVTGIDCSDIIYGGGAMHCLTQQQPVA